MARRFGSGGVHGQHVTFDSELNLSSGKGGMEREDEGDGENGQVHSVFRCMGEGLVRNHENRWRDAARDDEGRWQGMGASRAKGRPGAVHGAGAGHWCETKQGARSEAKGG